MSQNNLENIKKWRKDNPYKVRVINERYRDSHKEKIRKHNIEWRKKNKDQRKIYKKDWLRKNKHKKHAHALLEYAVKIGKVTRENCIFCNDSNSEAHHPNYFKPLCVIWVCRKHHRRIEKI